MPSAQTNTELSFEQLVSAVTRLPQAEFEKFVRTICEIRPSYEKHRLSRRESDLLLRISQGIPPAVQHRYDELIAKRDARILSSGEYDELLRLTDQVELLDAERVGCLTELARIRNRPLRLLMDELGHFNGCVTLGNCGGLWPNVHGDAVNIV